MNSEDEVVEESITDEDFSRYMNPPEYYEL